MKSINTLLLLCAALLLTADTLAEEAAPAKTLRPYAFKKGLTISYDINTSRSMNIGGQSYPRNLKATELLVVMNEEVTSTEVKQYRILSSTVIKDSAESDQLVDLIPTVFYVNEFGEMMRPGVSDLLLPIPTESGTTVTLNRGAFNVDVFAKKSEDNNTITYTALPNSVGIPETELTLALGNYETKLKDDVPVSVRLTEVFEQPAAKLQSGMPVTLSSDIEYSLVASDVLSDQELTSRTAELQLLLATFGDVREKFKSAEGARELNDRLAKFLTDHPNISYMARLTKCHDSLTKMLENYDKQTSESRGKYKEGDVPADFSVSANDGTTVTLSALKGKVVLVDFWASWCGPCRQSLPGVKKLYEKYSSKGFEIIGLSLDRDEATMKDFVKKEDMKWRNAMGEEAATEYGVQYIPMTFLIGRDGKIIKINASEGELDKLIGEQLK